MSIVNLFFKRASDQALDQIVKKFLQEGGQFDLEHTKVFEDLLSERGIDDCGNLWRILDLEFESTMMINDKEKEVQVWRNSVTDKYFILIDGDVIDGPVIVEECEYCGFPLILDRYLDEPHKCWGERAEARELEMMYGDDYESEAPYWRFNDAGEPMGYE